MHLDIKPDNIMLTASQKVKVCDFGVAHQLPLAESPIVEAPRWIFAGTPAYMAPEVIESNHFDARADIFLAERATRMRPFKFAEVIDH